MTAAASLEPTPQFSTEARDALAHVLVVLADNKYRLGLRYSEWCNSAPTLEAAVAAAALTQDELGHARSLYPVLRNFDNPPDAFDEDEATRDSFLNMTCLDRPFESWADFVAANSIPDQMLTVVFASAAESDFEPLRQRAAKILQEEHFHTLYAQGWCAQLAREVPSRAALHASAARLWPEVLAWCGPPNDPQLALLHAEGILDADGETLRARFVERVAGLFGQHGLEPPPAETPWDAWDPEARRLDSNA